MRGVQAAGADVRYLLNPRGRPAGVRVHWLPDEPGLVRGAIKSFLVGDIQLRFFVENDGDAIQGCHRRGEIYEAEELAIIGREYKGGALVDVGANVGNHAVYAVKVLKAAKVIAFEPEPLAAAIFEINAALNGCGDALFLHKIGLSDEGGRARPLFEEDNLGGTRLQRDPSGPIELVRGDDNLAGDDVGLIKIDTEGFELEVLSGLAATIKRCRPALFVEVENANIPAFEDYCARQGYRVAEEFRRYAVCTNFLALPN
jgi:FkbM family methyltransferase